MAFQKGHKLGKGRPPGAPNKRTSILEKCQAHGYDPFEAMIILAKSGDETMIKELCQYIEPKRKAIEHSGKLDPMVLEQAEEYSRMSNEELKKLIREELAKK